MSMIEVPDNIRTVHCDCDPHLTNRPSIGHIQEGVLHSKVPAIMSTTQRLPMSMLTVLPDVIPDNDPQVQSSEIPADDTVKTEQADENEELPAVKYMREIGYWSPPKYPSFKKQRQQERRRHRARGSNPRKERSRSKKHHL